MLDGEGVSRPLRYGLDVAPLSSGLESTEDERRLRFNNCELYRMVRMLRREIDRGMSPNLMRSVSSETLRRLGDRRALIFKA